MNKNQVLEKKFDKLFKLTENQYLYSAGINSKTDLTGSLKELNVGLRKYEKILKLVRAYMKLSRWADNRGIDKPMEVYILKDDSTFISKGIDVEDGFTMGVSDLVLHTAKTDLLSVERPERVVEQAILNIKKAIKQQERR